MRRIILLVLVTLLMGTDFCHRDTEPTEIEIVIVRAPEKNRNPYQTEYEQMLYPTVRINSPSGTGSGVIIATTDAHRYTQISIISAAHVVSDLNTVNIELYDSTILTGTVIITDTIKDIVLIKAEINTDSKTKIYTAKLADKDYIPYLFSPVWAVGCSLGLDPRPSSGHITAINSNSWEISAPILPGNSGGPVYAKSQRSSPARSLRCSDDFGDAYEYEVIGIAVWVKVCQGQLVTTMAGIVPIQEIHNFLKQVNK